MRKSHSNIVYHCEVINVLRGRHAHKHMLMHEQKQFQETRCMSGSKSGEFTKTSKFTLQDHYVYVCIICQYGMLYSAKFGGVNFWPMKPEDAFEW